MATSQLEVGIKSTHSIASLDLFLQQLVLDKLKFITLDENLGGVMECKLEFTFADCSETSYLLNPTLSVK